MADPPPTKPPPWIRHAGIGVNYVAAVAGFGVLGWWVDSAWDTGPWGVVTGAALGLVGATYNLLRESMAAFAKPRANSKPRDREESDHDREHDQDSGT